MSINPIGSSNNIILPLEVTDPAYVDEKAALSVIGDNFSAILSIKYGQTSKAVVNTVVNAQVDLDAAAAKLAADRAKVQSLGQQVPLLLLDFLNSLTPDQHQAFDDDEAGALSAINKVLADINNPHVSTDDFLKHVRSAQVNLTLFANDNKVNIKAGGSFSNFYRCLDAMIAALNALLADEANLALAQLTLNDSLRFFRMTINPTERNIFLELFPDVLARYL